MITRKVTVLSAIVASICLSLSANAESTRYLVQFKSAQAFSSAVQSTLAFNSLDLSGAPTAGRAAGLFGSSATVTQTLNHMQMMVVESSDALVIAALRSNPNIALIEAELFHPAPEPISTFSKSDIASVERKKVSADESQPWGIGAVKAPEAWKTTKGNGARVMVLDTGVDKSHPVLKNQIEAVKNFSGGDESDVTDTVGHGTHVSGTILADGKYGLVGVAPEAKLLMGKVCTEGGCSNIAIVNGLDWGVEQKVDVVSMSLGGSILTTAEGEALTRAEAANVMVVAASGNDGAGTVSFPAAAPTCLAVGAVDISLVKATFSNWGPELGVVAPGVDVISSVPLGTGRAATVKMDFGKGLGDVKSMPFVGSPVTAVVENSLVYAGLGKAEDFTGIDVKGKFALISRGEIPFKDKVNNAIAAGAAGVVVYNNAPGLIQGSISEGGMEVSIPAAMIEQTLGESAKTNLAAGQEVRAQMAIVKTDFASFQGTSMATPHASGVAALIRAANKSLTPAQVRDIMKSTATPLTPNDQNQYGAGMINAEAGVAKAMSTYPAMQIAN